MNLNTKDTKNSIINKNSAFHRYYSLSIFFGLTLLSLFILLFAKVKTGVDFSGGIVINFSTSENLKRNDFDKYQNRLQDLLNGYDFSMQTSEQNFVSLRFASSKDMVNSDVDFFKEKIMEVFDDVSFENIESIGPQISQGLIKQSFFAVMISMFFIAIYLLIQFNFYFAISGVIVLLCDVIISSGFAVLVGLEFNLVLIAALLTLIGYCINDTVILYDRIRTNARKNSLPIKKLFEISVKEVIRRSFVTSIVTIVGVCGILFFSDKAIRNFAIVLIFGIIVGTFGSIYISSSLPLLLGMKSTKKKVAPPKDKMFYAS